jgi:L-serine dehydratase
MRAARLFASGLNLSEVASVRVELYGSLAMTGVGHATDKAILLGLEGYTPEGIDPNIVDERILHVKQHEVLNLMGSHPILFKGEEHLIFEKGKRLAHHSNGMRFTAFSASGKKLGREVYYSVGGGFVVDQKGIRQKTGSFKAGVNIPYPYDTCAELLSHCEKTGKMIYEVVLENEKTWRSFDEVKQGILAIWRVMQDCVERGCRQEGTLPGGLNVRRRASSLYKELSKHASPLRDPVELFDWVSLFALAVNEENAAGGRIVTAPTNGAAGIIPAVLHYYMKFTDSPTEEGLLRFFLTATAIGILYKKGASLSAAEMGCQGEVGVACSMAAAGLTAALGGSNMQIENAAEIGMEHNLGLTCDPVGGLVQIPCIERNTMGSIKAINASRLAMRGNGMHHVSLDQVIAAMRSTGEDMKTHYKETSEGGLALYVPVTLPEC